MTIALATLLGLAERPGEAAGFGPLDPALARAMATVASVTVSAPCTSSCWESGGEVVPEQGGELTTRDGRGEIPALGGVAAKCGQAAGLLAGLDAFYGQVQPEGVGQHGQGRDDRFAAGPSRHTSWMKDADSLSASTGRRRR